MPILPLHMYIKSSPKGCFIALDKRRVVGYCISRVFGTLVCIALLAVHPDWQGQGIGKMMTKACANHLHRAGVETIDLETMPETPQNLSPYISLGFEPDRLSLVVRRESRRRSI